jgi:hypothetical protein
MTYRSLFVDEHPSRESATAPYVIGAPFSPGVSRFCSLNAYTWPVSAEAFAREHDLHTDYVDNCWVLIALDATLLRAFLGSGSDVDPCVHSIIARTDDDRWYVITEEEF